MKIEFLTKQRMTALAVAGGLTLAGWAQAQDTFYLENMDPNWPSPSALYPNWNTSAVSFNYYFTTSDATSGLEIKSTGGFGSAYYGFPGGNPVPFSPNGNTALSTNDTTCTFVFTVNPTASMAASGPLFYTNYNWIGTLLYLNMLSGIYYLIPTKEGTNATIYDNYSGWNNPGNPANVVWQGSNVTWTFNLTSFADTSGHTNFLMYTQGGSNYLFGFNIGFDPAVILNNSGTNAYDITLNSITFAPAPTQPPNLTIQQVGTNVVVTWPDPATNTFTLYQSANMAKFSWSPWGFAPFWSNGTNTVTIPPPFNTILFLRLANTNSP